MEILSKNKTKHEIINILFIVWKNLLYFTFFTFFVKDIFTLH